MTLTKSGAGRKFSVALIGTYLIVDSSVRRKKTRAESVYFGKPLVGSRGCLQLRVVSVLPPLSRLFSMRTASMGCLAEITPYEQQQLVHASKATRLKSVHSTIRG